MKTTVKKSAKKKISAFEKVQLLTDGRANAEYLLHWGKYMFKYTLNSAAAYYLKDLMNDPKSKAKATQLGIA